MRDTIAAVATAKGVGALGIVRISGPAAGQVLGRVVPRAAAVARPRRMCRGLAVSPSTGEAVDEVYCFFAPGPATATGEDVAEIHGHGGPVVLGMLMEAVLEAGARPAGPGEFTRRAFTNGRIDLTQAEAVMTLIGAESRRAARVALSQLGGGLEDALRNEVDRLVALAARIEAGLDFPTEDLPRDDLSRLAEEAADIAARLEQVASSFRLGARLAGGAKVAICGAANAGKSSLLNRLVGDERAIVDAAPGTTRDVVEARGEVAGIPLVFMDTAGLRLPTSRVEAVGQDRSLRVAASADVVLLVIDGADPDERPRAVDELLDKDHGEALVVAANKADLPGWRCPKLPCAPVVVSALTGEGMDRLKKAIADALRANCGPDETILTTARQQEVVARAAGHTARASDSLGRGAYVELAAEDLRLAREALGALRGEDPVEEVLDAVFASFCIGK